MREEDAAELRRLIPALLDLLSAIASGRREPDDAAEEYIHLHREVRRLLTSNGEECICPWPTVWGWSGYAAKLPDWEEWLTQQAGKAKILSGLEEPPRWTFDDYLRDGNPGDVPFWDEFVDSLEAHKQVVLDTSLNRELAFLGTRVAAGDKGHIWSCNTKRGETANVMMFKIRQGAGSGEVVLRVFFVTASDYRLVLLHGYDKGANAHGRLEDREAAEACLRRADLMRQRADGRARA